MKGRFDIYRIVRASGTATPGDHGSWWQNVLARLLFVIEFPTGRGGETPGLGIQIACGQPPKLDKLSRNVPSDTHLSMQLARFKELGLGGYPLL
jgi:hypothetical protein